MNWRRYFEWNRDRAEEIPWDREIQVEPQLRQPLIESLRHFQLGESGDGLHIRHSARQTGDEDYAGNVDLFIAEEQRHSRWMGEILRRLKVPLMKQHWSNDAFIRLRRLLGLKHELLILLVAEMIAKRYFRALRDGTQDVTLKAVFSRILSDEEGHLAFHIDYLQHEFAQVSLVRRGLIRIVWRVIFRGTCTVVLLGHGRVLRRCGVSPLQFWWDAGLIFDEVAAAILSCAVWSRTGTMTGEPVRAV